MAETENTNPLIDVPVYVKWIRSRSNRETDIIHRGLDPDGTFTRSAIEKVDAVVQLTVLARVANRADAAKLVLPEADTLHFIYDGQRYDVVRVRQRSRLLFELTVEPFEPEEEEAQE